MIKLTSINKVYQRKTEQHYALKDINLLFPSSGFICITGKSGSGKTTLLNIIGANDVPSSGQLIFDDNDLIMLLGKRQVNEYRATKIGHIYQEFFLMESKTVFDNLKVAADITRTKISRSDMEKILNEVELYGFLDKKCNELSGGERQRVSIARALVKNSQVILADEPTGSLDNKNAQEIFNILKKLSKNRLVIVATHDIELANQHSDRMITFDSGKIISDVSINEISQKISAENKSEAKFGLKPANIIWLGFLGSVKKFGRTIAYALILILALTIFLSSNVLANTTKADNVLRTMKNENTDLVSLIKVKKSGHSIGREFMFDEDYNKIKNQNPQIKIYRSFSNCTYGGIGVPFHFTGIIETKNENLNFIYGQFPQNQNQFFITKYRAEQILATSEIYTDLNSLIGKSFTGFTTHTEQVLSGIVDSQFPNNYAFFQENFSQNWSTYSDPVCVELLAFLSSDLKVNKAFINEYLFYTSYLKENQEKIILTSPIIETFTNEMDMFYKLGDVMYYTSFILLALIVLVIYFAISNSVIKSQRNNGIMIALGCSTKSLFYIYLIRNIVPYLLSLPFVIIISKIAIDFLNGVVKKRVGLIFMPYYFSPSNYIILGLVMVVTWIGSTFIPFIKILKNQPIDIIRKYEN